MALSVTHPYVSAIADSGDTSVVQPSDWNAGHTIAGLGTGVETALGVNVGTAGAFTTNNAENSFTANQSIAAGTLTTDVKVLDLSATWNAGGVGFTGIKLNVTDTASASSSLLLDLQVSGASKFKVDKGGAITTSNAGAIHSLAGTLLLPSGYFSTGSYVFAVAIGLRPANDAYRIYLEAPAAGTLELRNSTAAQTFNVYGTYTSSSSYHRCAIKTAKTTLNATAGATITATNLIPDGAFLIGVTTRVNTTCTTATGYTVGDGVDADLWGVASAVSSGTATGSVDFTATAACGLYIAAQSVVITATGGNFDGTGAIEVVAHYLISEAD